MAIDGPVVEHQPRGPNGGRQLGRLDRHPPVAVDRDPDTRWVLAPLDGAVDSAQELTRLPPTHRVEAGDTGGGCQVRESDAAFEELAGRESGGAFGSG